MGHTESLPPTSLSHPRAKSGAVPPGQESGSALPNGRGNPAKPDEGGVAF